MKKFSTHDNLIRRHGDGAQGKSALVNEYLSQHPYRRWGQIVTAGGEGEGEGGEGKSWSGSGGQRQVHDK